MILDIYKDALEFSAQDWKALVKLGIISIFSFFMLPMFLLLGYSYRVVKISVNGMIGGNEELPDFSDAIQMFIDGLKVFVVQCIYYLITLAVFLVFLFISFGIGGNAGFAIFVIGLIITLIVAIFAYLMAMLSVAHMAANDGSLSKAFNYNDLFEIIKSIGLLRLIAAYIGIALISAIIYLVVSFIIMFIFGLLGISTSAVGLGAGVSSGIFGIGILVAYAIIIFIAGPYISILQARTNGLLYNLY